MKYTRVRIESMGYELAPVVITSDELEDRLGPVYRRLCMAPGQLEALTGIAERRWWEEDHPLSSGAVAAARHAFDRCNVTPEDVEVLIYTGVCREQFEPATACRVAAELGVPADCAIFDLSNACLGMLNGLVDVANRIELGQIRAGLVVSCESSRDIVNTTIERLLENPTMDFFKSSLATMTGGSGAAAILVTDGSFGEATGRQLRGGVTRTAPQYHALCRWGMDALLPAVIPAAQIAQSMLPRAFGEFMSTDSVSVMKHGVELGLKTFHQFLMRLGWSAHLLDRVICHQVGSMHRETVLNTLGIPAEKDFSTFQHLGNMGTVSLPLTAAMAEERGHLQPGHKVGLFGIGSGLNTLFLGVEW
ncbi:MAG: 3-oxoacyl-ACP synthase III [Acidobacteriota bacterium]